MMNPTAVFLVSLISLTITLEGLLAIWEVGHTTLTLLALFLSAFVEASNLR